MDYIDLHIHSNHSDGLLAPEDIVRYAKEYKLKAISITDHDAISNYLQAKVAGEKYGVEIIPGIEISTQIGEYTIHLLGYYFDPDFWLINEYVEKNRIIREERAKKIINRLGDLGIKISFELVKLRSNGGVIGRPHIADVLLEEGYVFSFRDAFEKYLGENKAAYVPKPALSPEKGMEVIQKAGGLAFVAHPGIDLNDDIIFQLVDLGLDGIEIFHPKHVQSDIEHFLTIAGDHHLLVSGGSDCHGPRSTDIMLGINKVPYYYLEKMKEKLNKKYAVK
ncbi:PHP domain-containing protein [candidate division KSB1 bacterium]|nr:PHP domain-containing protein [candidate division KSB1 bacterium]